MTRTALFVAGGLMALTGCTDQGPATADPDTDRERVGLLIGQRGDSAARLVVDADGVVRWRLHSGSLISFSPNGSKALAYTAGGVTLLHAADGSVISTFRLRPGAEQSTTVWETGRTLLTQVTRAGEVAITRVFLDGGSELVTAPVRLEDDRSPYVLLKPAPTERGTRIVRQ